MKYRVVYQKEQHLVLQSVREIEADSREIAEIIAAKLLPTVDDWDDVDLLDEDITVDTIEEA